MKESGFQEEKLIKRKKNQERESKQREADKGNF